MDFTPESTNKSQKLFFARFLAVKLNFLLLLLPSGHNFNMELIHSQESRLENMEELMVPLEMVTKVRIMEVLQFALRWSNFTTN